VDRVAGGCWACDELRGRLRRSDADNERLTTDNLELRRELRDAELVMHELQDQFNVEEAVELRQLQRELDNTARDCRLLHFKVYSNCTVSVHVACNVM